MMKHISYSYSILALIIFLLVFPSLAGAQRLTVMDRKCQQESEKNTTRCLEWRAINILAMSEGDKVKIKKALDILNQAHAKDPLDINILSNMAACYIKMQDYNAALCFVEKTLTINQKKHDSYEPSLLKCMLEERLGFPRYQCSACYHSVVNWQRENGKVDTIEYVYAALLAQTPDCQQIKERFLSNLRSGDDLAETWNEILRDFDRKKYLHEILP